MPKRKDLKSILIIGSGPIVIGQACEFDYSGSQALRSLREDGIETVLINSNPATIMTDPTMADHVYLKPLTTKSILEILKEHPQIDAVLPTMGGQTALNLCIEADEKGIWVDHNAEDRDTLGLISIAIISSSSSGLTANCTLQPPAKSPILRIILMAMSRLL